MKYMARDCRQVQRRRASNPACVGRRLQFRPFLTSFIAINIPANCIIYPAIPLRYTCDCEACLQNMAKVRRNSRAGKDITDCHIVTGALHTFHIRNALLRLILNIEVCMRMPGWIIWRRTISIEHPHDSHEMCFHLSFWHFTGAHTKATHCSSNHSLLSHRSPHISLWKISFIIYYRAHDCRP